MTEKFAGRTVLVTGSAAGLGRAIALGFARGGAEIVQADINEEGMRETARLVEAAGAKASIHRVDMAKEGEIHAFAKSVLAAYERVDVLVNNAGLHMGEIARSFSGLSLEKWLHFFTVNSIAPVLLADALRPALAKAKGLIVNQCSMAAYAPGTAYGITKSTLSAMTFAMATQYASDEIRAVGIAPGLMATDASMAELPEEKQAQLRSMQMVRRQGTAEDIANVIVFVASAEGSFINNEVIITDGGNSLRGWRP
jgi:3-oxoacyl-[acyl-carrier protein] reductase